MDVCQFHRSLLGKDQDKTPAHWRLRIQQRLLYEAFTESGKCGLNSDNKDLLEVIGVLVLALSQTNGGQTSVAIFTPETHRVFVVENLKALTRHTFHTRRGHPKDRIQIIRDAFNRLLLSSSYAKLGGSSPGPWVSFGLTKNDLTVPHWIKECLL